MKRLFLGALATVAAVSLPGAGHAAVNIGDNVTCSVTGGGSFACNAPANVVQAGNEFTIGNTPGFNFLGADFGTGTLRISALQDSSLGATILNFQNLTSQFTGFALTGSSGFSGFDLSDISLNGGMLSIDLRGTNNVAGGFIQLDLGTAGAVPEPATWAMLILGFGLVGCAVRRRRGGKAALAAA